MKYVIVVGAVVAIAAVLVPGSQPVLALIGGFCIGVGAGWYFAQP